MGMIEDVLKALDRIPIWKRLGEVPEEVDDIKRRLNALEEKLGGKWPADVCKHCGERALRLAHSNVDATKKVRQVWECESCQHNEIRHA
jgi:hypothetical protein